MSMVDLGQPEELFYWGPTRANPLYMGDFLEAEAQNFTAMQNDPNVPNPPEAVVLFHDNRMVWLSRAAEFSEFVRRTFQAYRQAHRLQRDIAAWYNAVQELDKYSKQTNYDLVKLSRLFTAAWQPTLVAEFALYGSEAILKNVLERFDEATRQKIWRAFTLPDKPDFMQRIDHELIKLRDTDAMAKTYPWVKNGYSGMYPNAKTFFEQRLQAIDPNLKIVVGNPKERAELTKAHNLNEQVVAALDLARQLASFMDERKAWMMRTRSYIERAAKQVRLDNTSCSLQQLAANQAKQELHGWWYAKGEVQLLAKQDAADIWQQYVDYKSAKQQLQGVVACDGGESILSGVARIVMTPTEAVLPGQILVIPATTPSYVPLMRSARGLVTDHGGILSHAAIVAREFGLPCIVGTHNATKIIKDGDIVTLDLTSGEVTLKDVRWS